MKAIDWWRGGRIGHDHSGQVFSLMCRPTQLFRCTEIPHSFLKKKKKQLLSLLNVSFPYGNQCNSLRLKKAQSTCTWYWSRPGFRLHEIFGLPPSPHACHHPPPHLWSSDKSRCYPLEKCHPQGNVTPLLAKRPPLYSLALSCPLTCHPPLTLSLLHWCVMPPSPRSARRWWQRSTCTLAFRGKSLVIKFVPRPFCVSEREDSFSWLFVCVCVWFFLGGVACGWGWHVWWRGTKNSGCKCTCEEFVLWSGVHVWSRVIHWASQDLETQSMFFANTFDFSQGSRPILGGWICMNGSSCGERIYFRLLVLDIRLI